MTPVEEFCGHHFAYNGISDGRQKLVRKMLDELEDFLGFAPELADDGAFRAWLSGQLDRGLHVNTVRRNAGAVRPFFEWAWQKGHIDDGRYMKLRAVPNPRGSTGQSTPRPYKRKDIEAFWAELDERWPLDEDGKWLNRWVRGRSRYAKVWPHATRCQLEAIVRLALDCGLRRQEVFDANVDDIHPDNAFVVVRKGKGGKYREVPYTDAARAAVHRWLELRTVLMREFGVEHDSVWLVLHPSASPNNALHPSSPAAPMRFRAFARQIGTVGAWELHRLRHTCATERLRAGMKLENLQRFLGHAKLTQTLAYADIVRDDIHRDATRTEGDFARAVAA